MSRPDPAHLPATTPPPADDSSHALVVAIKSKVTAWQHVLPPGLGWNAKRMVALAFGSLQSNPALFECTIDSVIGSLYQCAKLGLEPDTPLAHAHLVPFENNRLKVTECQFLMGYQGGKILCVRGSEQLAHGRAAVVKVWAAHWYERDVFEVEGGTKPELIHKHAKGERGEYQGTYAVAEYADPTIRPSFEIVDLAGMLSLEAFCLQCKVEELDAEREKCEKDWFKSKKPWIRWRERQRLKSAIKRLAKQLIMQGSAGTDARRAFLLDDLAEAGKSQRAIIEPPPGTVTQLDPTAVIERFTALCERYPHRKGEMIPIIMSSRTPAEKLSDLEVIAVEEERKLQEGELTASERRVYDARVTDAPAQQRHQQQGKTK